MDHDHSTALVRGFLCLSCNTAEGHIDFGALVKYRLRYPAAILGVRVAYGEKPSMLSRYTPLQTG